VSCGCDVPQVGSFRSDWIRVVKVNRRKTNRRKARPYCIRTLSARVVSCCEHVSEPSNFIKGEEFFDWLSTVSIVEFTI